MSNTHELTRSINNPTCGIEGVQLLYLFKIFDKGMKYIRQNNIYILWDPNVKF